MTFYEMRREYSQRGLDESDLDPDPIRQFRAWFDDAVALPVPEPNAMTLATADTSGRPSARMVLLKGLDERGFTFYTNYESRKGGELEQNPRAALVFFWAQMERQIRIEGWVERVSAEESDTYFHSRPVGSQLGAAVSHQSSVIPSRGALERQLGELAARYVNAEVPRPAFWGGYRVIPEVIEFWQGRPDRLHDRLRYRRADDGTWVIERLSP